MTSTRDLARPLERGRARIGDELVGALRRFGEPLAELNDVEAFGAAFDRFGDARLVLLGEATHGTAEFYRARAAITRRLIERHGFKLVAVEADWPDAARIDDYVRHQAPKPHSNEAFARFPQWMWRNAEFADFMDWLRIHNRDLPDAARVAFRGLDLYSLNASIAAVLDYLERVDPARAREAQHRYGCLSPWQDNPAHYGRAVVIGGSDSCEDEVVTQLEDLLSLRLETIKADGELLFDAAQNARVVRAAERYYRLLYHSSTESWNLRDRHMFDTLQQLLNAGAANSPPKAVIWAHNSHVGNAAATAMGWQGEFNLGELCRNRYALDSVLIGFSTDRGTVAAASDWNRPMEIKAVVPARSDSYEHAFRKAGLPRSLTDWRTEQRPDLSARLSESLLERAIGVIYRPETELQSHYFESVLADQFDAFVWFEETTAVTPLPAARARELPETYPFGL